MHPIGDGGTERLKRVQSHTENKLRDKGGLNQDGLALRHQTLLLPPSHALLTDCLLPGSSGTANRRRGGNGSKADLQAAWSCEKVTGKLRKAPG